jgi:hypothetical protein
MQNHDPGDYPMSSKTRHPDEPNASSETKVREPALSQDTSAQIRSDLALQAERLIRTAHQEDLIDEALEETFPASDPISPVRVT